MNKNKVKLNYYEVMTLWLKVSELISIDNYYDEELINDFLDYVRVRTMELDVECSLLMLPRYLERRLKLYEINLDSFKYLGEITGIDIYNKEVVSKYTKMIDDNKLYFNNFKKRIKIDNESLSSKTN